MDARTRDDEQPYDRLTPDAVLAAVERAGFATDGRVLALNSYENRVYQIGVDDGAFVVAKFYRPGRWSDDAIREEHAFALELAAAELPVVAPLAHAGATLHRHEGYRYAVFPRRGGSWPDLDTADDRERMGRFVGRIHRIGAARRFEHRPRLSVASLGDDSVATVLDGDWLPEYLVARYADVTGEALAQVSDAFDACGPLATPRIHGDCHRGNVLWTDGGPHFVDLDDCVSGPAVQDLWMLLAGARGEMQTQLVDLLKGYEEFAEFDRVQLRLVEPLRVLRMIHYAAWLARRWHDPAFPKAFPWFGGPRYWEEHVRQLAEQLEALEAEPLRA